MKIRRGLALLTLPALLALPALAADEDAVRALARRSGEAYRAKDYPKFLALTKEALVLAPGQIQLTHNLACAEALNGHPEEAAAAAMQLFSRGIDTGLLEDSDLAGVRDLPVFAAVREKLKELRVPLGTATEAFRLKERTLLTEGIAHDPKTGRFFVSSVHERKIVAREPSGAERDFVSSGRDGILGVLALRADSGRRVLWATSAAMPEMTGFTKIQDGRSELLRFDLDSGRLTGRWTLPAPGPHNVNDLALDGQGGVYVSDARGGGVWRLRAGAKGPEPVVPAGALRSPQGLALSPDGKRLYVADYTDGLHAVDLATGAVQAVAPLSETPLPGIDALVADGADLLAVQNGLRPHRILRLVLDASGQSVSRADVLLRGDPRFDEPTLAVLVGRNLYVVAASQWPSFDPKVFSPGRLKDPLVLKITLPGG